MSPEHEPLEDDDVRAAVARGELVRFDPSTPSTRPDVVAELRARLGHRSNASDVASWCARWRVRLARPGTLRGKR
jgi:hypothetical protein